MAIHDVPEVEAAFPNCEGWASLVGGQLHARLKGALPPVFVHSDTIEGLCEQILQYEARGIDTGTNHTGRPARSSSAG
jgi:hypothetical protein